MQQMNDRTIGQNKVIYRSIGRSKDGQVDILIPVGGSTPASVRHEIEAAKALQNERAKKAVKVACCAGGGGLGLYLVGMLIVAHWFVITIGGLSAGVVYLLCKLHVDTKYRNRYKVKDDYNTSSATKTGGQTIIHNHYYN